MKSIVNPRRYIFVIMLIYAALNTFVEAQIRIWRDGAVVLTGRIDSITFVKDGEEEEWRDVALTGQANRVQPMTGMVLWPNMAKEKQQTHGEEIRLEFSYVAPCKVVTGKTGDQLTYDWSTLENILEGMSGRGHQAVLRFPLCYPSNTDNCVSTEGATYVPAYIKERSDYKETYNSNPGGDGPTYYPDWSNAELQWFVKQFYRDFAARYGQDPRIAFLEIGFGHWGEYHIYGTTLQFGKNFPTKAYQSELFQLLGEIMPIPWLASINTGDNTYSPLRSDAQMQGTVFGLFDDSFMHSEHDLSQGDGWNERCWQWAGTERWQHGVCGGEISYYTANDQKNFLNPAGMYGVTWEEAAAKYHLSFIICNDAPTGNYFTTERVRQAGMASGYRFEVVSCRTNGQQSEVTITNTGVAPIYRDAYPAAGNVRAEETLKGLLPGESRTFRIGAEVTAGNFGIVSDYILPQQQILYDVR